MTFGFETSTLAGGPYTNQGSTIYNLPMYQAAKQPTSQFWLNCVEQLVAAGVDFVAVDTRGYVPGSAVPNGGGDPRALTGLVDAINQVGAGQLKIAAFYDTPASMTDKKNQVKHHTGGYSPPFDMGDTSGAGEGAREPPPAVGSGGTARGLRRAPGVRARARLRPPP